MQNSNLHAEDKKVSDILFSNSLFVIPRYQRPYSWSSDQIEEFWNDLIESDSNFFLGTFVFNYENYDKKNNRIEVIDGQQRMLTIIILCAALRDCAKEQNNQLFAGKIQDKCIEIDDFSGNKEFRVKCGDSLNDFFKKHIAEYNPLEFPLKTSKEQKLVMDNYKYFKEKLNLRLKHDKDDMLDKIIKKISAVKGIVIQINNDEDAYVIFETVNDRGADLTTADLLKNLILKNIPKDKNGSDGAKEIWSQIEDNISDTGLNVSRFIRYFWLSKYSFVSEKELYREIKKTINADFREFLDDILKSSEILKKIKNSNKSDWNDVKAGEKIFKSIQGIESMRVTQCYVLFLCLLRNINRIHFDVSTYFKVIEDFTFKYSVVCKLQTNKVEKIFSRCSQEVEEELDSEDTNNKDKMKNVQRILSSLTEMLRSLMPSDRLFKEKFLDISYRGSSQSRVLIKYILSKINSKIGSGEMYLDFDEVNIEHILPQKPDTTWNLTHNDIKNYVNLLGNLTLVHKNINSGAGNKGIKEKINFLKLSEIQINRSIIDIIENNGYCWTNEEILKRQEDLADISFKEVWGKI